MTRVRVRSEALRAASARLGEAADELRQVAAAVRAALARCRSPGLDPTALVAWWRVETDGVRIVGPAGLWGVALGLDALATRLSVAARAYAQVEDAVAATMAGVRVGADLGACCGYLGEGGAAVSVRPVPAVGAVSPLTGPADLVALGDGLDGGRVRVVELDDGAGGSAWVVAVPGTQEWSPRSGPNPFDLTSDVRAVTGDATLAAAGVTAALERAWAASGGPGRHRSDPVLLVGHSQGGILAAALAADPGFRAGHRVTHLLTTGSPVGAFPVPASVRVLSVEHADDPVPTLDLTPNPARSSWLTLRVGAGPPVDVGRHALAGYVTTMRAAEGAPRGTVSGLGAWEASAGPFLHRPVRSVHEVVVERGWQNPPT
ncbi:hypothetical protein [Nostocoides sp. Soil756]|jgi:hypothetical protein|uniref:PGAP1-like alpha/beta domain-containing protein n=1 Tax=Nostocoides sp. Soil756 TaxID=1736399 RepID=UPI0006FE7148|nr:hypothetical protein [Tetrasphaera sp. Soil756]KRE60934.1 hypothetical protein ASG78_11220 [Tetrasphaera sp. Soil756]